MSRPKTRWPELLPLVLCQVNFTEKSAAARITIHGSASSTYISGRLYIRATFSNTRFILSVISFDCGFLGGSGLVFIKYYSYIKLF